MTAEVQVEHISQRKQAANYAEKRLADVTEECNAEGADSDTEKRVADVAKETRLNWWRKIYMLKSRL